MNDFRSFCHCESPSGWIIFLACSMTFIWVGSLFFLSRCLWLSHDLGILSSHCSAVPSISSLLAPLCMIGWRGRFLPPLSFVLSLSFSLSLSDHRLFIYLSSLSLSFTHTLSLLYLRRADISIKTVWHMPVLVVEHVATSHPFSFTEDKRDSFFPFFFQWSWHYFGCSKGGFSLNVKSFILQNCV